MNSERRMTNRQLQAIERRQQLLDASKKLFAKNGYHNTSVRSITQSIGMADGLIYHYFPKGKLEILHTIFRDGCETLSEHVNEILGNITDEMTLNEVLLYCCKELNNTVMVDNELIVIMLREKELLGNELRELLLHTFAKFSNLINNLLQQRVIKGEIRKLDIQMATHQFLAIAVSTVSMRYLTSSRPQLDTDAYVESLVEFTINSWKS